LTSISPEAKLVLTGLLNFGKGIAGCHENVLAVGQGTHFGKTFLANVLFPLLFCLKICLQQIHLQLLL